MVINIDGNLITDILLIVLCICAFGPVMDNIVIPVLSFIGKIVSSIYNFIAKPIRKICAAFDKWNQNPPKKDFESF